MSKRERQAANRQASVSQLMQSDVLFLRSETSGCTAETLHAHQTGLLSVDPTLIISRRAKSWVKVSVRKVKQGQPVIYAPCTNVPSRPKVAHQEHWDISWWAGWCLVDLSDWNAATVVSSTNAINRIKKHTANMKWKFQLNESNCKLLQMSRQLLIRTMTCQSLQ